MLNISSFICFMLGCKVFKYSGDGPVSKVFIQMVLACTGGGIFVPIFLNGVPVSSKSSSFEHKRNLNAN